jgi:photosystem II stability/assembly factor-like uncharacterized protein
VRAGRRRGRWFGCAATIALIGAIVTLLPAPAGAHTPHDNVSDVAFSPTFARDGKVFTVAASRLFVSSSDSYHWRPIVRGLPRAPEDDKTLARIAMSPSDRSVMYVTSRVGGVYRSDNGGTSFQQAVTGLPRQPDMQPIAVAPKRPLTVLVAGAIRGFYRSVDGGRHWSPVAGFVRVPAVEFVPATGRAVAGDDTGRVAISDDDGATWRTALPNLGASVSAVAASSGAGPAAVFVGDSKGHVARSDDGGTSFARIGTGLPNDEVASIALSPDFATDHTVWASMTEQGVYRSTDGGRTWVRRSRGLTTDIQAHVVHVAEFGPITAARGAHGIVLYEGGYDGLFRSDDGGDHWHETQTLADFVVGLSVSPDYPHDHSVAAATYVKGAYLSTDRGDHWRTIDHGLDQAISAGNKFAPIRRLHNITFSPDYARDHTIFSAGWTVFLKSTDRGGTWTSIQVGPRPPAPLLRQYVLGVAPDYAQEHTLFLGTRQGDIFRSDAAGDKGSWRKVGNVGARVRSFGFASAGDTTTIYVGTADGVMRSDDNGATWKRAGPAGESMVAVSPKYATDGTVFAGTDGGLFVSREHGAWQRVPLPATGKVEALALSPAFGSDRTVLVSVTGSGLYRSTDGGRRFTATGADLLAGNHVIADFTNPTGSALQFSPGYATDHTVFGYASQDIVRSTDAGATWTVLRLPSATTFLREVGTAEGTTSPGSGGGGGIGKRRVAVIGLAILVLLAIAWFLYRRSRRSRRAAPATTLPPTAPPAESPTAPASAPPTGSPTDAGDG